MALIELKLLALGIADVVLTTSASTQERDTELGVFPKQSGSVWWGGCMLRLAMGQDSSTGARQPKLFGYSDTADAWEESRRKWSFVKTEVPAIACFNP